MEFSTAQWPPIRGRAVCRRGCHLPRGRTGVGRADDPGEAVAAAGGSRPPAGRGRSGRS
jgi:hypothetical protein